MYYYGELSVETIAELLNCPVGTVKTRLKSSRAKIKEGVKKYEKDNKDAFAGIPAIPFLTRFFNTVAENLSVPQVDFSSLIGKEVAKSIGKKATVESTRKSLLSLNLLKLFLSKHLHLFRNQNV